jgi:hypothetical protein
VSEAERHDLHVTGSAIRCPFCHDALAPEAEWVACASCLARHHPGCWSEVGACSSCSARVHLVRPGDVARGAQGLGRDVGERPLVVGEGLDPGERRLVLGLALSFLLVVGGGALIGALIGGVKGAIAGAAIGVAILVSIGGGLLG